jgi:hypothetical protein
MILVWLYMKEGKKEGKRIEGKTQQGRMSAPFGAVQE